MTRNKVLVLLLSSSVFFAGCTATGQGFSSKQTWGTAIGAVAGSLLGNQVGSGSGRTIVTILGGIAGGVLGNVVGSNLDQRDREELAKSTNQVLASGKQTDWSSSDGDVKATIKPKSTRQVNHKTKVARSEKIAQYDNLNVLNETWKADKSANLRSAPSTDAAKVGGLQPGQTFNALGKTDNKWIAVSRKGMVIGYVYEPLVSAVPVEQEGKPIDLDNISVAQAEDRGFDLDAFEPESPVVETVNVQTSCQTLEYDVKSSDGSNNSKEVEACKNLDGTWELG